MQNALSSPDVSVILTALLQITEFREGLAHGQENFCDEYDGSDEQWNVKELVGLVIDSSLTKAHLDTTILPAYLLEKWNQGHAVRFLDYADVEQQRERLGQNMFYYGLGFLLGFIDQGLRPVE